MECWDCLCLAWDHGVEVQAMASLLSTRELQQTFYWLHPKEGRKAHSVHKFALLWSDRGLFIYNSSWSMYYVGFAGLG